MRQRLYDSTRNCENGKHFATAENVVRFILIRVDCQGDEIKAVKMNWGWGGGRSAACMAEIMVGNLKERDHMENLGTDEAAVL